MGWTDPDPDPYLIREAQRLTDPEHWSLGTFCYSYYVHANLFRLKILRHRFKNIK
jgi:hypothetical protein